MLRSMSTVLLVSTAILLVQVDGAPVNSTRLIPANNVLPPPGQCVAADEYWNYLKRQCAVCVKCGLGYGSTASECGNGTGEKGMCVTCQEGTTYQDQGSTQGPCQLCKYCDENAVVLSNCTTTCNTDCGPCKPGYGYHANHPNNCSLCRHFNDDEKPQECLTTPAPPMHAPSPSPPSQPTLTSDSGSGRTQNPARTTSDFVTTMINSSLATPGSESETEGGNISLIVAGVFGGGVASAVAIAAVILRLVILLLVKRWECRHTEESQKTPTGTEDEKECLNVDVERGAVQYVASTSVTPTIVTQTEADGIGPTQEAPLLSSPPVVNRNPIQSTEEDVGDEQLGSHTTNGDVSPSPSMLHTIPEEVSNYQSSATDKPSVRIQDSSGCKKIRKLQKFGSRTFKRSLSEPADQNTPPSSPTALNDGESPLVLPPEVRESCNKNEIKLQEKNYNQDFNNACSYGRKIHWADLNCMFRKCIEQMLTPTSNQILSSYKVLGEELRLNCQTELKSCANVNDVFEVLSSQREVTMEEVLLSLNKIQRKDVARKVCNEVLTKPPCKCNWQSL